MLCRPASAPVGERRSRLTGHPGGEVGRVEGSDPGGGELEGERQPVEVSAHADDRGQVGRAELQVRTYGAGPVDEQGDRRGRDVERTVGVREEAAGATGWTRSPSIPSRSRLVASTTTRGQPRRMASTSGRTPSRTCSQLSSTRSSRLGARKWTTESTTPASGCRRTPSDVASAGATAAGSVSGASSHHETPSANWPDTATAARPARRVLPTPPIPVSVTSRASPILAAASAMSSTRPTKLVASAGASCGLDEEVSCSSVELLGRGWRPIELGRLSQDRRLLRAQAIRTAPVPARPRAGVGTR